MRTSICDGWEFVPAWSEKFADFQSDPEAAAPVPVRLPHTAAEVPLHYADPSDYEMVCGYRRRLDVPSEAKAPRVFLRFDGAAHQAEVFVNGELAGSHRGGYTAFELEITDLVRRDGTDEVAVRLDTREDPTLPPFGFVIDYLCYGGLYREAWLVDRPASYISDVFVTTPTTSRAVVALELAGELAGVAAVRARVLDANGRELTSAEATPAPRTTVSLAVLDAHPWTLEDPALHSCVVELLDAAGEVLDTREQRFGFRTAEWRDGAFYLNGEKTFLRGLNRHQSFPYIGYAAPASLQREDARILHDELACTAVRTSHYPQSQHFLDACDELGLLVFTEFPGWQHIGDEAWKNQACETLREMIVQWRNHPSIVLWGVRINESTDDDEFYARTNAIAHELDPTRATSGVRYLEKSHLLEDVYAYNDFSHDGTNAGCKAKRDVTPDMKKPLIISESNGHMYPTKPGDDWPHRAEHALRHARVLNAAYASGEHAGCFEWCMFDYATHKDFGSGDRICYHGVLDSFRNPKLAAAVWASQGDAACGQPAVLAVGSSMDIGDYPAGQVGTPPVFTNASQVRLYKNDVYVTTLASLAGLEALPHQPLVVSDTIGELLETQEGFEPKKAAEIRDCLNAAAIYTLAGLPLRYKLKLARLMLKYHMSFDDGVALYGKYVGNWGGEATRWRFDALDGAGEVTASVMLSPASRLALEARPSATELVEGDTYDMAAVRMRVLDENGNIAPYAQLPVTFALEGEALGLVGPAVVVAEGGMCGCYLRTCGIEGEATLVISTPQTAPVRVKFTVRKKD